MRDSKLSATMTDGRPAVRHPLVFHPWYGLAGALYMVGITLASSMPRHPTPRHVLLEYGLNLGHIPLFAGLAFLIMNAIAPRDRQFSATPACAGAALFLVAFAALDEWHQAFVPGRSASVIDFLLDVMGIGAVLLFYRLAALVSEES